MSRCIDCGVTLDRWNGNRRKCGNWYSTCKPCQSFRYVARKHGLTIKELQAIHDKSMGVCAICGNKANDLDHCHKTGKIRDILCHTCNVRIERIENNRAIRDYGIEYHEYLERHKS